MSGVLYTHGQISSRLEGAAGGPETGRKGRKMGFYRI